VATQEEVNAACAAIAARGERPTVERVRVELQGGSPNSLTPQVRAWKDTQRQLGNEVSRAAIPVEPATLPTPIQRALDNLAMAVGHLPLAFSTAVAEVAEIERRRSRLEVEAIATDAIAKVDEARLAAEDERAATDAVRIEVAQHETAIVAKDSEIERLAAALAERDHALIERTTEVDRLTARIEQEQARRAEADRRVADLISQGRPPEARSPHHKRPLPTCKPKGPSHARRQRASNNAPSGQKPMRSDYGGRGPKAKPSPAMPSPGLPKPKARSRPCGLSLPPIVIRIARKPQHRSPAGLGPRERLRQHHSAPARPPVTPVFGNADPERGNTKSRSVSGVRVTRLGRGESLFPLARPLHDLGTTSARQKGLSINHCTRRAGDTRRWRRFWFHGDAIEVPSRFHRGAVGVVHMDQCTTTRSRRTLGEGCACPLVTGCPWATPQPAG
jgi:hypothetical protein